MDKKQQNETPVFVKCGRCGGKGVVNFGNVTLARRENGQTYVSRYCFECHGDKGRWSTVEAEEARQRRNAKARERRAAKRAANREANAAAFAAQIDGIPGLVEAFDLGRENNHGLLADLHRNGALWGMMSPGQIELALKVAAELFESTASRKAPAELPTGRVQIEGTVTGTRVMHNAYGSTLKIRVKDDRGFTVWGTCPASIAGVATGARVSFVATIETGTDSYGFFKRPTKAAELTN